MKSPELLKQEIMKINADIYWLKQDIRLEQKNLNIATHLTCFFLGMFMMSLIAIGMGG